MPRPKKRVDLRLEKAEHQRKATEVDKARMKTRKKIERLKEDRELRDAIDWLN